jgi:hypothetical protein
MQHRVFIVRRYGRSDEVPASMISLQFTKGAQLRKLSIADIPTWRVQR